MSELLPFMRGADKPLPSRRSQQLAFAGLGRYFDRTWQDYPQFVTSDPEGDLIAISTGSELNVLTQAPQQPELSARTVVILAARQAAIFRYRSFHVRRQIIRIAHPIEYSLDLNDSIIHREEPDAQQLLEAEYEYIRQVQAAGVNYVPVGAQEIGGLTMYLDAGTVLQNGGASWAPQF